MDNSLPKVPTPRNEPVLSYPAGSPETRELKEQLSRFSSSELDIPLIIDGKEIRTGNTGFCHPPHNHRKRIGVYHKAGPEQVQAAIHGSLRAYETWSTMPATARSAVFLKAADLLSTKYRFILNAATMLGQSKTCYQAEIDSACELIDFFRFNVAYQQQIHSIQPDSGLGQWNRMEYRPLEGFVFAVTPFNFTSIAGNLPTTPALMGNVVLWKPASSAVYSSYFIMKLLEEAGLPPGVIQFVPGSGGDVGNPVIADKNFAGLHFTGSTSVFQQMWKDIGNRIGAYRCYPRIVGETGGKDFVFAHTSADVEVVATALIRGAFEYQGQKCSAASRAYVPKSLWPNLKERLIAEIKTIRMGDVADFGNFMSAVIDRKAYDSIRGYIDGAKNTSEAEILVGGGTDDAAGYFIEPTVIQVSSPTYRTMCEEIFGPVLSLYIYDDQRVEETLRICDKTSPYALTGAILAQDRAFIESATRLLTHSAGNFYVNNKPTGAVVNQQPFGGGRGSGTNDKAGSIFNLLRWVSVRTISETFAPPVSYRYPFMEREEI